VQKTKYTEYKKAELGQQSSQCVTKIEPAEFKEVAASRGNRVRERRRKRGASRVQKEKGD
jgi:hypothetical protein